jgi:hypothetical protein
VRFHERLHAVDELVAMVAEGARGDIRQLASALTVDEHHLGGQDRPVVAAVALGQVDDQREERGGPT